MIYSLPMVGVLSRWREDLSAASMRPFGPLAAVQDATEITHGTWDDLEALPIQADLGAETTAEVVASLPGRAASEGITR